MITLMMYFIYDKAADAPHGPPLFCRTAAEAKRILAKLAITPGFIRDNIADMELYEVGSISFDGPMICFASTDTRLGGEFKAHRIGPVSALRPTDLDDEVTANAPELRLIDPTPAKETK